MLAAELDSASGPEGAAAAVDRWASDIEDDAVVAGWHYRTAVMADMAGQLMVRAVELEEDSDAAIDLARSLLGARDQGESFLGLRFEEAIEFFLAKRVMTPAEFEELRDRYRAGGFTAVRLKSETLRESAKALIGRGLEGELTLAEITAGIRDESLSLGITPADNYAIESIVRTNVATAYGHGKWKQMNDPEVVQLRPLAQVVTAGDSRVRRNHAALNGMVVELGSDLAATVATPLGHQCRCANRSLSRRQFDAMGLEIATSLPPGGGPDEGWESAPAPL